MTTLDDLDFGQTIRGFAPGQKLLKRYTLTRVLGQGGMGVVWLARDEELERDIALKFLPEIVVNDRSSLNELKRETRRSLELTHPNIVRIYDFVQDATIAGISMEYIDGDTLRNLRGDKESSVFETSEIAEWVRQLCGALEYAHNHASIVHRDLKPANLMINGKGQLKVADFGIARSLSESMSQVTVQRGVSGTLVYMSPQQLAGDPASPLDDIYALGATLYELLTGKPPFFSGDIWSQVREKTPQSIAERRAELGAAVGAVPENWQATIMACLAKDPAQRPQSAAQVGIQLGLMTSAEIIAPVVRRSETSTSSTTNSAASSSTFPLDLGPAKKLPILPIGIAAAALTIIGGWYFGIHKPHLREQEAAAAQAAQAEIDRAQRHTAIAPSEQKSNTTSAPAAFGGLIVKTDPPSAMVKVGDLAPAQSPAIFQQLARGAYQVAVTADGYESMIVPAEVRDGQVADLGTVKLTRSVGEAQILTASSGATYELKSKSTLQIVSKGEAPAAVRDLPTGEYELTVLKPGWPARKQPLVISKEQPARAEFDFTGGHVNLVSEPAGATVEANGEKLGVTPIEIKDVEPGQTTYTFTLNGYKTASLKATIKPGETTPVVATLTRGSSGGGGKVNTKRDTSEENSSERKSGAPSWLRYIPSGGGPRPPFP